MELNRLYLYYKNPDVSDSFYYMLPETGKIVIGRDEGCEIRVDDERVSRRHCQLVVFTSDFYAQLTDLGSRNGTFIKEEKIDTVKLDPDITFRIGKSFFKLLAFVRPPIDHPIVRVEPRAKIAKAKSDSSYKGKKVPSTKFARDEQTLKALAKELELKMTPVSSVQKSNRETTDEKFDEEQLKTEKIEIEPKGAVRYTLGSENDKQKSYIKKEQTDFYDFYVYPDKIALTHFFDTVNQNIVQEAFGKATSNECTNLIFDFRRVREVNPKIFEYFIGIKRSLERREGAMMFAAVSDKIRSVLDIVGLSDEFAFANSSSEAVNRLASKQHEDAQTKARAFQNRKAYEPTQRVAKKSAHWRYDDCLESVETEFFSIGYFKNRTAVIKIGANFNQLTLFEAFNRTLEKDCKNIVFDFNGVSRLSPNLFEHFVSIKGKLAQRDGNMVFANVSNKIYTLLDIANMRDKFVYFDTIDQALDFLL